MKKLLVLFVCLLGCVPYHPPQKYDFEQSRVISKDFDATWSKIISWFSYNNIPIKILEKASGYIATEITVFPKWEKYWDCGYFGNPEINKIYIENAYHNFNVQVERIDSITTKVTALLFMKAYITFENAAGHSKTDFRWVNCESNGQFEKEFFDYISK